MGLRELEVEKRYRSKSIQNLFDQLNLRRPPKFRFLKIGLDRPISCRIVSSYLGNLKTTLNPTSSIWAQCPIQGEFCPRTCCAAGLGGPFLGRIYRNLLSYLYVEGTIL